MIHFRIVMVFLFLIMTACNLPDASSGIKGVSEINQENLLPNVTIVVASYDKRHDYHEFLYESFKKQDYKGKVNLLIYDNGEKPSPFFSSLVDNNVRYEHTTKKPIELSLGAKRNWLADNADGDVIVVWDDDDFYGENYVSFMVKTLVDNKAHLVKPIKWLMGHFNQSGDALEYHMVKPNHTKFGWGFGFCYKKLVMNKCRYGDVNRVEEDPFAECIDKNKEYKIIWQEWEPLNQQPIQLKFESSTPNNTKGLWITRFQELYKANGSRHPESNAITINEIESQFSQKKLLNKYIEKYFDAGKK